MLTKLKQQRGEVKYAALEIFGEILGKVPAGMMGTLLAHIAQVSVPNNQPMSKQRGF